MTIGRRDNHVVFLLLRKARTEAELQRRSCSVGYPGLVALTHAALIGHGYRVHQPSEFHRMVEIGGGSCTLANVPALARCVAMSCSAFAERFKDLVGETPLDHLTQSRMVRAAGMILSAKTKRFAEIASAVGYDSESSFGKAFRRVMGVCPGKYRRGKRLESSSTS